MMPTVYFYDDTTNTSSCTNNYINNLVATGGGAGGGYITAAANCTVPIQWVTMQQAQPAALLQQAQAAQAMAFAQQPAFPEIERYDAAERQRNAEEHNERMRERDRQRNTAQERAKALLHAHLNAAQRRSVERHGWFEVRGQITKRKYRISTSCIAGNIHAIAANGNERVQTLCCHADPSIPAADHHLAQKLMLEADEERFLRTANVR